MDHSTIAAISTPNGLGGIGIIKISGTRAVDIARKLFRKTRAPAPATSPELPAAAKAFASHRLYHGFIFDTEKNAVIDEVLLAFMQGPKTYTGEDIVEINAHAGPVVLNEILQLVLKEGARLAAPGEFTKRAFLNGRIDLSQAEAVCDIISAKSSRALENAEKQLSGGLGIQVQPLRDQLVSLLAQIEAAIDFPEDVGDDIDLHAMAEILEKRLLLPLKEMIRRYEAGKTLRDGVRMIITGRPNVGKSSLMNQLLEKERVIVSDIPGTTRDLVEDMIYISGIPVVIADSAGLHETKDPLETIGMALARRQIQESDIILFLVEAQKPISDDEFSLLKTLPADKTIVVENKIDLVERSAAKTPHVYPVHYDVVRISAKYNHGLDRCKEIIAKRILDKEKDSTEGGVVPGLRHKIAFEEAVTAAERAKALMMENRDSELAAIDLNTALECLGRVTGQGVDEAVLDEIFGTFCIGK